MKRKEIFYISNIISLSRFLLVTVLIFFLLDKNYLLSSILLIVIWISDLLDGYFARNRNEISELGKIIDPLADKAAIISLVIILLIQTLIPLWFVIIILMRDVFILAGGLFLKKRIGYVLSSTMTGKISVFLIGFTMLSIIVSEYLKNYLYVNLELFIQVLVFVSITAAIISLTSYGIRFVRTFKKEKLNDKSNNANQTTR